MKKPEEYLTYVLCDLMTKERNEVIKIIKQIQINVYNQALEDAVENVSLKYEEPSPLQYCECKEAFIDKQSILKLKK